ncbi:MAG TPA: monovalent cation/H(+) antiporter subunit G [Longimicrobiales bacterium]|nr:monovalent cation/H(+) antiporter subunit G [Longimicrobiales bacterium]
MSTVAIFFLFAGAFFLAVSAVGLLRLPDFFTRAHAVGKSETLGALLILAGLALHQGFGLESAKLFLILIFVAVTTPSGLHTLSREALRSGCTIWTRAGTGAAPAARLEALLADADGGPGGENDGGAS